MSRIDEHRIEVARTARYYCMGGHADPAEVWMVLHGYGYLARRFMRAFRPIADDRRRIVAPEGLSRFYYDGVRGHVGASWMTAEDRQAEIADYVRYLDEVHRATGTERARMVVLGFSQGAATAARWACMGTADVSRLILWGGSVPPDLDIDLYRDRLNAMNLQLVLGDSDEYADADSVAAERQRLVDGGISYTPVRYPGRHEIDADVLAELAGAEHHR